MTLQKYDDVLHGVNVSYPAERGRLYLVSEVLDALKNIMQRANESGPGEMKLIDTIHAMHYHRPRSHREGGRETIPTTIQRDYRTDLKIAHAEITKMEKQLAALTLDRDVTIQFREEAEKRVKQLTADLSKPPQERIHCKGCSLPYEKQGLKQQFAALTAERDGYFIALDEISQFCDCEGPGCRYCDNPGLHPPSVEAKIALRAIGKEAKDAK